MNTLCRVGGSLHAHPLVPAGVPIYGYIHDVKSGLLIEVSQATEAGKA